MFLGKLEVKKLLKKIFCISDEANHSIIIASLCMSLFQIATILPVVLLAYIVRDMMNSYFSANNEPVELIKYLVPAIGILLIIYFAYKLTYHKKYLSSGKEDKRLRILLADKIRKLPLSYLGRRDISDLTSVIMDDVTVTANTISTVASELISGFVSGIIILVALFFVNKTLCLSLALCLPGVVIVMAFSKKISENTNIKNKQKKLDISDGIQEYLENIKLLKSAGKMEEYQKNLAGKIKKVIGGLIGYELLSGLTIAISYNIMRIGLGIVIIEGSALLVSKTIDFTTFFLFLFVAVRIYEPITNGCEMLGELIYSMVSAGRVKDLLNEKEQEGEENVEFDNYDIEFKNVSFAYKDENVLNGVSFTAKQGEITALVGPSGCGKSTLCKLAARFWETGEGTVSIGNRNVNSIAPETLYKNYSIVFQDVVLFNDTIFNNIKIGKENATDEEVYAAARLARCEDFINKMPDGYETIIGENGKTLSGGERQRLSIARAFLKDAPVILLDESTASIDPENETKIQEAIGKLIKDKTVLIIAHKLRSIVDCDKIVVLKEGRVEEMGTHTELLENNGLYNRLYTLQNDSAAWTV